MREFDLPDALPIGTIIAGYEIKRVLGQGGFGIAYQGYSADLETCAAIKEFFPRELGSRVGTAFVATRSQGQLYGQLLDKFIEEARTVRGFNHPNIVKVRHLERANNTAYMVMDYIDGGTLLNWARAARNGLNAARVKEVFLPIIAALESVHAAGKLHRDISPMNILVSRQGAPYLIDFGAAKHDWQNNPGASTLLIAHPHYAPPERMIRELGNEIAQSPAVDVYSLAAVMYEILAGERPTPALTRQHQLAVRRTDPLPPLARVAKIACPKAVTDAIDQALSFDIAERPQSMAAFRETLGWAAARTELQFAGPLDARSSERDLAQKQQSAADVPDKRASKSGALDYDGRDPKVEIPQNVRGWDDGDKIKIAEPAKPAPLSAWITGLPDAESWSVVLLAAVTFASGLLTQIWLFRLILPTDGEWAKFLLLEAPALFALPLLVAVHRPHTGTGLTLRWLAGAGLAAVPIVAGIERKMVVGSILVAAVICAEGGIILNRRRYSNIDVALTWLGLQLTVLFAVIAVLAAGPTPTTFSIAISVTAVASLAIAYWKRTNVRSPVALVYALPPLLLAGLWAVRVVGVI